MRQIILAVFFASIFASAAPAASGTSAQLRLIDLTDDYERAWKHAQKLPEAQRVSYFKGTFAVLLPGFYDAKRWSEFGVTPDDYDRSLAKKLAGYPDKRSGIKRVSAQFKSLFQPARQNFEGAFGPMRGYPPIYLVNAHGEFDGGTRELPAGVRLIFGADVIDKLYRDKPIQPFFHHELFHLLHARTFRQCPQLWCSLWAEGLATYVASSLNPTADDAALLLTEPKPIRQAVDSNREEAVCAVLSRFDSQKGEDYEPIFTGGSKSLGARLPPRFGYYVGLLVAQDLGKTRSLKQLADLDVAHALPLVRGALNKLARCG
jgi:hypothetical protein